MKKTSFLSSLACALLLWCGAAGAAVTAIAQLPLLNIDGSGNVKPNLMLLYDNSGSMTYAFTPDYIDDSVTCRSRSTMAGGTRGCTVGQPPFNSSDFNRQYYDPKVRYSPPVYADGTTYPSMTRSATSAWTSVTTDGFGVNRSNLLGSSSTATNIAAGFPDLRWCDTNTANCVYNSATYSYPTDARYTAQAYASNPYYYTINVAEYCTDATLTKCQTTAVGAAAPAGYTFPAKVRWCDSTALTNCQAKYVGNFIYPRFGNPNGGLVAAYGTITIGTSGSTAALTVNSVSVTETGGAVVITNGAVAAPAGTNTLSKQVALANAIAASIIAKTGLTNQYLACVRTPPSGSSVPACSTYGITLGTDNVVAVIPIDCATGTTGKATGICSVVADSSRSGWPITVNAAVTTVSTFQPATALITVSGNAANTNTASKKTVLNNGTKLDTKVLMSNSLTFGANASNTTIASNIVSTIGTNGTITAYVGGNAVSDVCDNAASNVVCLVDTSPTKANAAITMGSLTNPSSVSFKVTAATTPVAAVYDTVPTTTTPLGSGAAVFVRTDIVAAVSSYPKTAGRTDCAGATCTYDEEMTNFSNWYAYYKTRNQMMKTSVGLAFQALTSNYNVGIVSLSTAAAEGTMTPPAQFTGQNRVNWYNSLYTMDGNQSTPMRQALHAVGKLYAGQTPYTTASGSEVIQYACQQNITFITTDGYWNGGAAATVVNNDNTINPARFCTRASGCYDGSAQTYNSLADVALYWYNGGSNTGTGSLRTGIEDYSKTGLVPGGTGENTRLHMNTYALGLGVDGVMNYEPKYDVAATPGGDFYKLVSGATSGCSWVTGACAWPDPKTSDSSGSAAYQSRVDDLWHAAINGHGHYYSASAPAEVVQGLSAALSNIVVRTGAASAAATSTPNITQLDNDIFSSTFTTVKWFGEITDRKINLADGTVSSTATWNSSDTVGRLVGSNTDTRNIWMQDTGVTTGIVKPFLYASMTAGEKAWFDNKCASLSQCPNLSATDRVTVNSGATIVNWLRGQQQYADGSLLRAYTLTDHVPSGLSAAIPVVLGDIASSKPAYVRDPRKAYSLDGYSAYQTTNKTRAPATYVAANDGMLHAFNALTGTETWAYVPRITMKKLYLQASTTYGTNHQFTTDGAPEVADVKIGANWRTVLVAGLNGGGRGYYALDVTNPAKPVALWELCADSAVCSGTNYDADIGLTFGNPQFGMWKDSAGVLHWVVFLTSGYNNVPGGDNLNVGSGAGYLYVVDVATGAILDKTSTDPNAAANASTTAATPTGFARITAITLNPLTDPKITYVYGGDNQGKMFRFDYTAGGKPVVIQMADAGNLQPVTTRPEVTSCAVVTKDAQGNSAAAVKNVVAYGTGRLLDSTDIALNDVQSVYVLKDSGAPISAVDWRTAAKMPSQKLVKNSSAGVDTYSISGGAVDLGAQAGWYMDLDQNKGERINIDPKVVSGTLNVVSNLPTSSSSCSVGGTSNLYQLDVCTATPLMTSSTSSSNSGSGTGAGTGSGNQTTGTTTPTKNAGETLSSNSAAVGFIIVRLPDGTLKLIATTADGKNTPFDVPTAKGQDAHKAGWRRVRD